QYVEDELIVALGGEHDERVGDRVGDDAHLLLEDGRRALRLAGGARGARGAQNADRARPARERDAAGCRGGAPRPRRPRGSHRAGARAAAAAAASAEPGPPTEAPGPAHLLRRDRAAPPADAAHARARPPAAEPTRAPTGHAARAE